MFGILRILFPQMQAFMGCRMHELNGMFLILQVILAVFFFFFFFCEGQWVPNREVVNCWGEFPFLQ